MSGYTIPSVVEKTLHGERAVDIYSRLLSDRIIYIGTEIDDGVANVVIAQLLHLESERPEVPISLYLNSPGGSVTASLAIYDTMQFVSSPVHTTCVGQAASSAVIEPPGELMYRWIGESWLSDCRCSSWAITTLATPSSISVPRKMIRSVSSRE